MRLNIIGIILISLISYSNLSAQWSPDIRLTNFPLTSTPSYNNARNVASDGLIVHVIWSDHRDGGTEIYYKRSTDGGLNWGVDTRLTNDPSSSGYPTIALSGQYVYVVWQDSRDPNYELYYKRSTDRGLSWGVDTRLTNADGSSYNPSISVSGSYIHIVWSDHRNGNYRIYYKRSTDGGLSWEADTLLSSSAGQSLYPCVSVSGQNVHVVWYDNSTGQTQIYYKHSTDTGSSWGTDIQLTTFNEDSRFPCIDVSGQLLHVVWCDRRDVNYEIYYKRSTDNGDSWGADTRLTNDPDSSWYPSISAFGSFVNIVWRDTRDGNYEIYYKQSTDEGITWEEDIRLTNNSFRSEHPSIALSDSVLHVVWQDNRDGNYEIYYKQNPTGNVPVELTSFTADIISTGIELNWSTATETNNSGFEILRSTQNDNEWKTLGFVPGYGTTTEKHNYSFIDDNVIAGKYFYRLKQIDYNGSYKYLPDEQGIEVEVSGNVSFELSQNFPNPFNPTTKISWQTPVDGMQTLKVFDVMGNEVATLVNEFRVTGNYEAIFNASNLASGIYIYRLQVGDLIQTKKMLLMK